MTACARAALNQIRAAPVDAETALFSNQEFRALICYILFRLSVGKACKIYFFSSDEDNKTIILYLS